MKLIAPAGLVASLSLLARAAHSESTKAVSIVATQHSAKAVKAVPRFVRKRIDPALKSLGLTSPKPAAHSDGPSDVELDLVWGVADIKALYQSSGAR